MLAMIIIGAVVLIIYVIASSQTAAPTIDKLTVSPDLVAKSETIAAAAPVPSNQIATDWLNQSILIAKQKTEAAALLPKTSNTVTILQNLDKLAQATGLVHPETLFAKVVGVGAPKPQANLPAINLINSIFKEKQTTIDNYKLPTPLKQIIINTPTVKPPVTTPTISKTADAPAIVKPYKLISGTL
jgi:hypothetical protein